MRRIAVILAGFSVITSGLACQHTAGVCDCWPLTPPCMKYGLYTPDTIPVAEAPAPAPAPIPAAAPKAAVLPPTPPQDLILVPGGSGY
jgi:hypothetical protein